MAVELQESVAENDVITSDLPTSEEGVAAAVTSIPKEGEMLSVLIPVLELTKPHFDGEALAFPFFSASSPANQAEQADLSSNIARESVFAQVITFASEFALNNVKQDGDDGTFVTEQEHSESVRGVTSNSEEGSPREVSFTLFNAATIVLSIVIFFRNTYYDVCYLLTYNNKAENLVRFPLFALMFVISDFLPSCVCYDVQLKLAERNSAHCRIVPNWWNNVKLLSVSMLVAPPLWFAQELYYGLKSRRARDEEKETYLALMREIQYLNDFLRGLQSIQVAIHLISFTRDIGPLILELRNSSAIRQGALLFVQLATFATLMKFIDFFMEVCRLLVDKSNQQPRLRNRPGFVEVLVRVLFLVDSSFTFVVLHLISFNVAVEVGLLALTAGANKVSMTYLCIAIAFTLLALLGLCAVILFYLNRINRR